jgi:hypothetical protein
MPKSIIKTARPDGGWSLPVDTEATRLLHERYSALCGQLDKGDLMLIVRKARGDLSPQVTPFTDGYVPFAEAVFSAGHTRGTVLVSFPYCADTTWKDGDLADRALTVHTIGEAPHAIVDTVVERLIEALPVPVVGQAPSIEEVAPLL